jgi:hypothetical protein
MGLATAPGALADGGPNVVGVAHVGELALNLVPPDGMSLVSGLNASGDRFLYLMNERFKLVVLAAYARIDEYQEFCQAMERGEYRPVPNIALVAVPRRMHSRSYDAVRTAKEIKRYVTWFTLATNTRLIAVGMEGKANRELRKKLGVDLDFTYKLGKASKVFHRTPSSLGVGVLASFKLGNGRSDNFVAAAVYQMADKLIFLSMEGLDRSDAGVESLRSELLKWGGEMAAANAPPAAVIEAKGGEPAASEAERPPA